LDEALQMSSEIYHNRLTRSIFDYWTAFVALKRRESQLAERIKNFVQTNAYKTYFNTWKLFYQATLQKEQKLIQASETWEDRHETIMKKGFFNKIKRIVASKLDAADHRANKILKTKYFKRLQRYWIHINQLRSNLLKARKLKLHRLFSALKSYSNKRLDHKNQDVIIV
jgi:hypothetical protein